MDVQPSGNVRVTILLPLGVRRLAEQNAKDARRSLSNYLAGVLADCIDQDQPGLRREPVEVAR
jgi:hypothetical protein